jgi:hypothetical protein
VAGRLAQPDVARDNGPEDPAPEVTLDLFHDLPGEMGARVKHGHHQAPQAQVGVQRPAHQVQRAHQLGEPLQRQVLALDGDDDAASGGDQRVDREDAQTGGQSIRT